jgi:hypothetical protein
MAEEKYQAIGKCTYCGAEKYSEVQDQPLGREHMVSRSLFQQILAAIAALRPSPPARG